MAACAKKHKCEMLIVANTVENSLKPLLYMHLIFGYDYGLFQSNILVRRFVKFGCAILVCLISAVLFYMELSDINFYSYMNFFYPAQYLIEALLTTFIYGPRILKHFHEYSDIDEKLKVPGMYYKNLKYNNIWYIFGLLILTFFYVGSLMSESPGIKASSALLFVLDVSFVLRLNFFNLVRYRLRLLRKNIEACYSQDLHLNKKLNKDNMVNIDSDLHVKIYKSLADQLDDFDKCIGLTFMISLGTTFWRVVRLIFDISIAISVGSEFHIYFITLSCSLALHSAVFLGAPGLCGEYITLEVKKMTLILANRLLKKPGEEEEKEIKVFLEYMTVRPLSYWIWRIVPVNVKLISAVLNFCGTVLIILLQFSFNTIYPRKFDAVDSSVAVLQTINNKRIYN